MFCGLQYIPNFTAFCGLTKEYVKAITDGRAPCIQDAVKATSEHVNREVVEKSVELYKSRYQFITAMHLLRHIPLIYFTSIC